MVGHSPFEKRLWDIVRGGAEYAESEDAAKAELILHCDSMFILVWLLGCGGYPSKIIEIKIKPWLKI